jgi:hypothetical protein
VTKAEADALVATGKFGFNAVSTGVTEKDPAASSSGGLKFGRKPAPKPKVQPKKKKGKK